MTPKGFLLSNQLIGDLLIIQEVGTLQTTLPRLPGHGHPAAAVHPGGTGGHFGLSGRPAAQPGIYLSRLRTTRGIEEWEYRREFSMNFDPLEQKLEEYERQGWAISAAGLAKIFDWDKVPREDIPVSSFLLS